MVAVASANGVERVALGAVCPAAVVFQFDGGVAPDAGLLGPLLDRLRFSRVEESLVSRILALWPPNDSPGQHNPENDSTTYNEFFHEKSLRREDIINKLEKQGFDLEVKI